MSRKPKVAPLADPVVVSKMSERFLNSSIEFLEASNRAFSARVHEGVFVSSIGPAVVCAAFAVELGLKAIFIAEKHATTEGHELHTLFVSLPEHVRQRIKEAVPTPSYPMLEQQRTFEDALKAENDTFVKWRYSCEGVADLTSDFGFLKQLAKVAQSIAAEHMATAR